MYASRVPESCTTKGRGEEFNWLISPTDLENQRLEYQCTALYVPYFEVLAENGMLEYVDGTGIEVVTGQPLTPLNHPKLLKVQI